MIVRILGSAAGGGFPQWNCNCGNCNAVRDGSTDILPRMQTSIAISSDGRDWALLDASPDLRAQIGLTPSLHAGQDGARRSSPIKAVVVTGMEIDQVAGLLNLREAQAFKLHATPFVLRALANNSLFNALAEPTVTRHKIRPGEPFQPFVGAQMEILPIAVPGKGRSKSSDEGEVRHDSAVGLIVSDKLSGKRIAYVPCCAAITEDLIEYLDNIDVLLFDGTLYSDHELIDQKLSDKTGAIMGHISMSGADGAIARLENASIARRIFIHLNNSNPVLSNNSRERSHIVAAGWDVAFDGMEFRL
jgi:pyrroloquinoline quinone biosynthesis protein B